MKVTIAIAKGIIIGAALIAVATLTNCTTSTTTLPDGTVTVIKGSDPAAVAALSEILAEVAKAQIIAEK
jgi:hypothetical protein